MDPDKNELQNRFKEIVSNLPEEKKKALYKRLKDMDSEERNKTIEAIVKKDQEVHSAGSDSGEEKKEQAPKAQAPVKPKEPVKKPQPQKKNPNGQKRPQGKPQQRPQGKQQGRPQGKPQGKQQGKPQNRPQGKPQTKQQGKPQGRPQGKPQSKPQGKPQGKTQNKPVAKAPVKKPDNKQKVNKSKNPAQMRKLIIISSVALVVVILGIVAFVNRAGIMSMFNNISGNTVPVTTETSASSTTESSETSDTQSTTSEEPTPTPTPAATPTPVPLSADAPNLSGLTIVIDPGHQQKTSEENERVATWMSAEKSRSTSGGVGISTGIHEYELTLNFSMILKNYLEGCGANVIMTRTENNVDLSNQERAKMATSSNCDLFLRIHADSANDSKTSGIQMYVPSTGENYQTDMNRGKTLGEQLAEIMQIPFNGVLATEVYTGLNYAKSVNSLQISLGYLTNSDDEAVITNEEMQYKIVVCLAKFCEQYKK